MSRVQVIFPDRTALIVDHSLVLGRDNFKGVIEEEHIDLISKKHLQIFAEGNFFFVEDGNLGQPSANGTKLNGKEISGFGKQPLRDGDRISVADVVELSIKFID